MLRTTDVAAITGTDFLPFRFTKTDIRSRLIMYPSLTTPGRVRMQATSYLRIKIARDFFWGFHVYENFDSKPPIVSDCCNPGLQYPTDRVKYDVIGAYFTVGLRINY